MSEVLDKLKTRGYWEVLIRPNEFIENRVESLSICEEVVRALSVQWGGWDYPHYEYNVPSTRGLNHIEQSLDWEEHLEFWRYYQSGQFIHFLAMREDWQDRIKTWPEPNTKPSKVLHVSETLYRFTVMYEFAARLAAKGLLGDTCKISITLHDTMKRILTLVGTGRWLRSDHVCGGLESILRERTSSVTQLIAKSAELAFEDTIWVFERFNWDNPPRSVLLEDQRKLIERKL